MSGYNFSQTTAFLWSVADLLRGDFKQLQYGRIILPFRVCPVILDHYSSGWDCDRGYQQVGNECVSFVR